MAIQGIDFGKLSLVDALDLAILIEEEAKERYEDFADQMEKHHTPEAARFFRHMAENESRHGEELAERRAGLFPDAARTVTRAMIYDVEAPDFDAARAFMGPRRAMAAALASEVKARMFFEGAMASLKDAGVCALFQELRDEEVQHQELVAAQIAKLPPDSGLPEDAFGDEPTAQ
jgi:erythrin-vacuolar iron transport family protein